MVSFEIKMAASCSAQWAGARQGNESKLSDQALLIDDHDISVETESDV